MTTTSILADRDIGNSHLPSVHRLTGLCGLAGGLLFFAGDMLMYGHWGAAADFPAGRTGDRAANFLGSALPRRFGRPARRLSLHARILARVSQRGFGCLGKDDPCVRERLDGDARRRSYLVGRKGLGAARMCRSNRFVFRPDVAIGRLLEHRLLRGDRAGLSRLRDSGGGDLDGKKSVSAMVGGI